MEKPIILQSSNGNAQSFTIIAFFSLIAGGVCWYFYRQGKNEVTIKKDVYDTKNGTGPPTNKPDNIHYLTQLAGQIHDDLDGINLFANHDETIYNNVLALSNTDFVAFYNIWNTLYQQDYGKPLKAAIEEHGALPLTPWATVKETILTRMNNLNLL